MKELLCYIAQNLADNPDQVSVEAVMSGDAMTLQLRVAQEDMGKVIGRQGRIAKEIRTLLKAAGDPSQMGRRLCGEPIFANSLGGKRFHHLTKAR